MARSSQVAKIGREMRQKLSKMVSDVMLAAADGVEAACPVQTGHLLSNFILSTRSPHTGVEGSPDSVSYAAQDNGREKILAYDVGRDGRIFLTNNVDYLSLQPPFVTDAMMSAVSAAPKAAQGRVRSALRKMAKSALKRGL